MDWKAGEYELTDCFCANYSCDLLGWEGALTVEIDDNVISFNLAFAIYNLLLVMGLRKLISVLRQASSLARIWYRPYYFERLCRIRRHSLNIQKAASQSRQYVLLPHWHHHIAYSMHIGNVTEDAGESRDAYS